MKVCILGGGSPFGISCAQHFLRCGDSVFGIGRSPAKGPAFTLDIESEGYRYFQQHLVFELDYVMQILDRERPQVIVNFAAQGERAASFNPDDNWRYYQTNTLALAQLVGHLVKRDWLQRFVQIGTSELYGSVSHPVREDGTMAPTSAYAISKGAFDMHLLTTFATHKFPMNIIRPSNGYCPGQQLHRVIPKAIICALKGEKLLLHGGGLAEKSYLYGDDISRAIGLVVEHAPRGTVYNCGPLAPLQRRRGSCLEKQYRQPFSLH
jgi:dTDP-glucose 4,6-dehydratase